jgi:hypothetical protein
MDCRRVAALWFTGASNVGPIAWCNLTWFRTVKRTESLTYRNKKVYDGEFVQGMRHGRGQVYLPVDFVDDGSSQEGQALIEPRVLELGAFRSDIQDYGLSMNPSRLECRFGTSRL